MIGNTAVSRRLMATVGLTSVLSACAAVPTSGPSTAIINSVGNKPTSAQSAIKVIDVTDATTRAILAGVAASSFHQILGDSTPIGSVVGKGDVLDIAIWEAPPATLFGTTGGGGQVTTQTAASGSLARGTNLPEQMVDSEGQITVPFAGRIKADGATPQQIAREITRRLTGKAHQPQAIVRLVRNEAATVTVVGDVATSTRVPLPVIYRVNMKDPSTFFIAQSFPIRNKDVLYVSNAPLADFQKFLGAIFSTVLPAATTAAVISQTR